MRNIPNQNIAAGADDDRLNQLLLNFEQGPAQGLTAAPFRAQLLKWVGNKQRFAHAIIQEFPQGFGTYREPFLGSGAVLGTLAPQRAVGSDIFKPLIEIFQCLKTEPDALKRWYAERWERQAQLGKEGAYEQVKASYNAQANGADLLYLSRTCYGGVVRFRRDGFMSTPCGPHKPMPPASFNKRVDEWARRVVGTTFKHMDYREAMAEAVPGDVVYCDPPYVHSQTILYGAQRFRLEELFAVIAECKARGVHVVLSIDGTKKSGNFLCDIPLPPNLFEREISVSLGGSMLKRFQMEGQDMKDEAVADRLLTTF